MSTKAATPRTSGSSPDGRLGLSNHNPGIGPVLAELTALADAFGALDVEVQRFKPIAKLHEAARKRIQALHDASPPDGTFILMGAKYEIQIGQRENERKVTSMRKLAKALKDAFFDHCGFPVKIIDALLPGEKQAGLVVTARTGTRPVKSIPLPLPEETQAA